MSTYTFQADEISCQGCVDAITRAIQILDSRASVAIHLVSKRIEVESLLPATEIKRAIEDAGYDSRSL